MPGHEDHDAIRMVPYGLVEHVHAGLFPHYQISENQVHRVGFYEVQSLLRITDGINPASLI